MKSCFCGCGIHFFREFWAQVTIAVLLGYLTPPVWRMMMYDEPGDE